MGDRIDLGDVAITVLSGKHVHFDDAFPPISRHTDTKLFEEHMKHTFSKTKCIVPETKVPIAFGMGKENLFA